MLSKPTAISWSESNSASLHQTQGASIRHPAVTSAIIGPRTMEQLDSQLPAADVTLDEETLNAIDEIADPGVTLNLDDNSYGLAELDPAHRRR